MSALPGRARLRSQRRPRLSSNPGAWLRLGRCALLAMVLVAAGPRAVEAATYTVSSCMQPAAYYNHAWTPWQAGGANAPSGCLETAMGGGSNGAQTGWTLVAPAGAAITQFQGTYSHAYDGGSWQSRLDDGASPLWSPGPLANAFWWWDFYGPAAVNVQGSWKALRLVSTCVGTPCQGYLQPKWTNVRVTIDKTTRPSVSLTGGGLGRGGWVAGVQRVYFAAADASGIERSRLWIDGRLAGDDARSCDFSLVIPCLNLPNGAYTVDTTGLSDGDHTVAVEARDATGANSAATAATHFNVSNHAPSAPMLSVDGGGAWQGRSDWTLRWTNPATGDPAPIATATYQVCRSDGSGCYTGSAPVPNHGAGAANSLDGTFGIIAPGRYTVSLWLQDAAGNTTSSNASNAVPLAWDNAVPGTAEISAAPTTNGWMNAAQASAYSPEITIAAGGVGPPSGLAGYAVTTDGTTPGSTVTNPISQGGGQAVTVSPPTGGWPEGTDTIEARAISEAGIPSASVATASFAVDRTAPAIIAEGYGNPAPAWQPAPVNVRLVATDATAGMGASDDSDPKHGGYITYTVDTGSPQSASGGLTTVALAGQGRHWITFRAYDVAGNGSEARTIYVNVGSPSAPPATSAGFSAQSSATATFTVASGFGVNCPAQATLAPSRDTFVDEARPAQVNAGTGTLVVRSGMSANARVLLDFSLPSAEGCAITSAQLRLYGRGGAAGRTLQAFRAGSPWTDTAVTWNIRPGSTGGPAATVTTSSGWQTLDVTSLIRDIYSYGDDGLIVRDAAEGSVPAAAQGFSSGEGSPSERPQLVVTYG